MTDYNEQVRIPRDFFEKTLKEYHDWHFAWFRETAQNAADAGATQIDYFIKEQENNIRLSIRDNGSGIDLETLRNSLLTLGGSIKSDTTNKQDIIGGYGTAKHIILFAHQHYHIQTRDIEVSGKGIQYHVNETGDFLQGTQITVLIDKTVTTSKLIQACRQLLRNYQTKIKFTLNSRAIRTSYVKHDFQYDSDLWLLQFSEDEEFSGVTLWIRVHGLPMFRYHLLYPDKKSYSGTLDLKGEPTELLTTNRDGLNSEASEQLEVLIYELIAQPQWFKPRNELNIIFNPIDNSLDDPRQNISDVLPFSVPPKLALKKELVIAINQIQELYIIITYPDHFHLHITQILLRKEHHKPEQITLSQVKYSLNLQRTRMLAWCWYFSVQWVLRTEFIQYCLDIEFDEDNDCHIITESENQQFIIRTGFVFDDAVEGVNIRSKNEIKILLNPVSFQSDWLIGDVLDLAIHECAHCIELTHGEIFNDIENQIRKDFRRMIDEEFILSDAKGMLEEIQQSIKS